MAYQSLGSVDLEHVERLPDCQETIKLSDLGLAVKLGKRGYVKGDLFAGCDVGMSL